MEEAHSVMSSLISSPTNDDNNNTTSSNVTTRQLLIGADHCPFYGRWSMFYLEIFCYTEWHTVRFRTIPVWFDEVHALYIWGWSVTMVCWFFVQKSKENVNNGSILVTGFRFGFKKVRWGTKRYAVECSTFPVCQCNRILHQTSEIGQCKITLFHSLHIWPKARDNWSFGTHSILRPFSRSRGDDKIKKKSKNEFFIFESALEQCSLSEKNIKKKFHHSFLIFFRSNNNCLNRSFLE